MIRKHILLLLISSATLAAPLWAAAEGASTEGFYAGANLGMGMPNLKTPNGVDKDSQAVAGERACS